MIRPPAQVPRARTSLVMLLRLSPGCCTQWSEPACWGAAWRWRAPVLASWSSPGRRKTVIWKRVLVLPSFCTVTHIPVSQPILLMTRGKWGREGKQVYPISLTFCHIWSVRGLCFVFVTFPVLSSLCYAEVVGKYWWEDNHNSTHIR